MKKALLLLAAIILTITVESQNYTTIGNDDKSLYCVWKIQVLDSHNNAPLKNAKIELYDDTYKIWSIMTNYEGVAIVLIYDITKVRYSTLKVTDQNYEYTSWEKIIYQDDYYGRSSKKYVLAIPDARNEYLDWSSLNSVPSAGQIANYISNNKYKTIKSGSSYYRGPAFFEFTVYLTYNNHPKNNVYINKSNSNNSNSDNNRYQEPTKTVNTCTHCNGTGKCSSCEGKGKIYSSRNSESYSHCRKCGAKGECPYCGGKGKL